MLQKIVSTACVQHGTIQLKQGIICFLGVSYAGQSLTLRMTLKPGNWHGTHPTEVYYCTEKHTPI